MLSATITIELGTAAAAAGRSRGRPLGRFLPTNCPTWNNIRRYTALPIIEYCARTNVLSK